MPLFRIFTALLFATLLAWSADIVFPKLTSQVVDEAGLFSSEQKTTLASILKNHETNSSNQVVIVTIKSLKGQDISEYGYKLGREWGIGQKEKNNGVLLIIAPNERKIRIEVGYGLEGVLTDAYSKLIISNIITPYFKKGDYYNGTKSGIEAIINTINGEYTADKNNANAPSDIPIILILMPILFLFISLVSVFMNVKNGELQKRPVVPALVGGGLAGVISFAMLMIAGASIVIAIIVFLLILFGGFGNSDFRTNGSGGFGGFSGDFHSSGNSGFGGFSGGGGSFGGGGASGDW